MINFTFEYVYPDKGKLTPTQLFIKTIDIIESEILKHGQSRYLKPNTAFECLSILDDSGKYTFTKSAYTHAECYDSWIKSGRLIGR